MQLVEEKTTANVLWGVYRLSKVFTTRITSGIKGIRYTWLRSYLTDTYQYVQRNHFKSDFLKVTPGVPQGSVLGCLYCVLKLCLIC